MVIIMYDLILFDLDGTLTNPEKGITKSVQYALRAYGIEENRREMLRRFIGPPLVDGFMEFYGMTREDALGAVEKYRERFSVKGIFENELIEGTEGMLTRLKSSGKRLALATSKPSPFSKKILEYFKIADRFDFISCSELDGTRNDKAEVIAEALRLAGNYENPVMVGDRMHDIIGAKKNGIPCIGVSFGFAAEGELEEYGAVDIADSVSELTELLLK